MKGKSFARAISFISRYAIFFLIVAFVVTCCMTLFLHTAYSAIGVEWTKETIAPAGKITFVNVLLLSLLWLLLDGLRRYFTVARPIRRISEAAKKVVAGDFSVRVEKQRRLDLGDGYNQVIDYFNQMVEELSNVETLRTDFVANVSHELKAPLAVMQSYGTMLQQPDLPEEKRLEYAKAITASSRRLADMISNILKLTKLESQSIYPDAKVYDLGEQLCESLLCFEEIWEQKKLEIEADIDEAVLVSADPELLALVWSNLFSNAVKFTPPGGKIFVSLHTAGERAFVTVRDTGCGMTPEIGKHIFEKFYQGDVSHAGEGNGLGLALVRRVIDIVGGAIQVESEVGKGSAFTVSLRREQDEKALS